MENLSDNEKKVLDLIGGNNDISMRDICKKRNVSGANSAYYLIHSLEKKGEIRIEGKNTNKRYIPIKPYTNSPQNYGSKFFPMNFLDRDGSSYPNPLN